ncbi:MAG: GHKL domain-containing protein [Alphaproteobacteria bacterium]|nr:GHKL domain-containing protein [Alphaproteobacteria bacterium]
MKKKKAKILQYVGKLTVRTLIINIPALFILLGLLLMGKLTWVSASISLFSFWGISAIIIFFVFKDLDNFINYLKNASQNFDLELPRFRHGFFSSARLANTFQSFQNSWRQRALSDIRVLENLPDPILMVNEKEMVVFANESARSLWKDEVVNYNVNAVFSDMAFTRAFADLVHQNTETNSLEWQITNNKKASYFQVRMERLPTPSLLGAFFVVILHDITPFKAFKKKQADFFANASHELKTPLAILSGVIETLQGPAKDDPAAQEKFLKLMSEQTHHMTVLVKNLLQLAHMQQEGAKETEPVFINELLSGLVDDFELRSQKEGKQIVLEKEQLPRLMANRADLYRIFQNLLDNALKYGTEKKPVTIKTFLNNLPDSKEWVTISVHNFGKALSQEEQDRLFDRFYRVNSTQKVEGTGLGLSIVHQLVQKYDGKISVESAPEKGITFTVSFPLEL